MPIKIFFRTFGCKTNQYDSALIGQSLERAGLELTGRLDAADWVVVNTCSVTKRGEDKARQWVRSTAREHPEARIAVVGCSVEAGRERFAGLDGVRLLLGTEEKFRLGDVLARANGALEEGRVEDSGEVETVAEYQDLPVLRAHPGRARGYVKIQDGCDNRCTYCIVPLVRGASRSRRPERVAEEVAGLEAAGHAEAVLTGIHIGRYGADLPGELSLAALVRVVLERTGDIRLRLSSVESGELDGALIELVSEHPRVCRHMHVPLQHGSDRILELMERGYSSSEYAAAVERLTAGQPEMGLGTDVIVGFPGETEDDFRSTMQLVDRLPFTYLHVFPYSPRPGTPAENMNMKDRPSKKTVRGRVGELRQLGREKHERWLRSLTGKRIEAIREAAGRDGVHQCRGDNYCLLYCREDCPPGRFHLVAGKLREDGMWAALDT